MTSTDSISVLVPTRNEQENLLACLTRIKDVPEVREVIVIDSSDDDQVVEIAQDFGCQTLKSVPGRGTQIALGSRHAKGEIIWIIHADTWPHPESGQAILRSFECPNVVGGAFTKRFREATRLNWGSEWRCHALHFLANIQFGDQALFVRAETLRKVGGFPEVPLMEEFELIRKITQLGRLKLIALPALTSARRFQKRGALKLYWTMTRVMALYYLGKSPEELARIYR